MKVMTPSPWSTDLTALCERLARRLRSEGAAHPEAAAVALAVRGSYGIDSATFAHRLGIGIAELEIIESGWRRWDEVPLVLADEARSQPGIDLARLGLAP